MTTPIRWDGAADGTLRIPKLSLHRETVRPLTTGSTGDRALRPALTERNTCYSCKQGCTYTCKTGW